MSNTTKLRLKSASRLRLSDAVYETLLEAILSGSLPTGAVVSELSLSKKLQVSRTPVHDALKQLEKDDLIQQKANHRAVVASFTADDVFDVFEMRILLEGEAARRAATRMDAKNLTELRTVIAQLSADLEDPGWIARWTDFDEQFHAAIAQASGSLRLARDISRYRMLHRGMNKLSTTVAVLQQAMTEHARILDALEARNPKTAESAMVDHLRQWQAYFVRQFNRPAANAQ